MFIESIGATEAGLQAMSWDAAAGPGGQSAYQLRDNSVVLSADRTILVDSGIDPDADLPLSGWEFRAPLALYARWDDRG